MTAGLAGGPGAPRSFPPCHSLFRTVLSAFILLALVLVLDTVQAERLASDEDPAGDVQDRSGGAAVHAPEIDLRMTELERQEDLLRFRMHLEGDVPSRPEGRSLTYLWVAHLDGDPDLPARQAHDTTVTCTLAEGAPRPDCRTDRAGLRVRAVRVLEQGLEVELRIERNLTIGHVNLGAAANIETGDEVVAQDFTSQLDPGTPFAPPTQGDGPTEGPENGTPGAGLPVLVAALALALLARRQPGN